MIFTAVGLVAAGSWLENTIGWPIKKFVKTVRRYRTIQIHAGDHVITAAGPLPGGIQQILEAIKTRVTAH